MVYSPGRNVFSGSTPVYPRLWKSFDLKFESFILCRPSCKKYNIGLRLTIILSGWEGTLLNIAHFLYGRSQRKTLTPVKSVRQKRNTAGVLAFLTNDNVPL